MNVLIGCVVQLIDFKLNLYGNVDLKLPWTRLFFGKVTGI